MSRSIVAALGAALLSSTALAQGAVEIPAVTITVDRGQQREGSTTVPGIERQREEVNRTPASVGFIDGATLQNRYTSNLRDALQDTPGVDVRTRYSQELRLSVRGSGIARSFHTRGIEILQDGIPTNLADGSGDFYQIDPLFARSIEIWRGGAALPFGSSTLGGAINAVSPTAHTALAPNILRFDVGSFGTLRAQAQLSRVMGPWDFLVNATVTHSDGWRRHETQSLKHVNANIGYRFNERVETRFFLGAYYTDQKLPGTLGFFDAINNPRRASAAALAGDQARNTHVERLANRTTFTLDSGRIDVDSWVIHKSLYHPIFQVIDQDGFTYGIAPRYVGSFELAGFRNDLIIGARLFGGANQARQYVNIGGQRGALTVDGRQRAFNLDGYIENRFYFLPNWALTTGFKLFQAERAYSARGGLPGNPTPVNATMAYGGLNPRVGLLYEPVRDVQIFANLTRSTDVPDFSDLTQTVGATSAFVPLKAQRAWTAEFGARGRVGAFAWDVTVYRSDVRDQMLQFTVNPSIPAATFNAHRTLMQGIEFGGSFDLLRDAAGQGDRLTLRQTWTAQDFRFVRDPQYGGNRLAGAPPHILRTSLSYAHPAGFTITPSIDIVPTGAFVDFSNSFRVPGYWLLGLASSMKLPNGGELFIDARNLTNRRTISDFATVQKYTPAYASFYPGQGRSVFGGVRFQF